MSIPLFRAVLSTPGPRLGIPKWVSAIKSINVTCGVYVHLIIVHISLYVKLCCDPSAVAAVFLRSLAFFRKAVTLALKVSVLVWVDFGVRTYLSKYSYVCPITVTQ